MEESEDKVDSAEGGKSQSRDGNLRLVQDVLVEASMRVGTCSMTMGEVLQLESGDVVQMNESVDDPVLLFLNDKLVATGEVVLAEDRLALKIIEILKA